MRKAVYENKKSKTLNYQNHENSQRLIIKLVDKIKEKIVKIYY